MKKKKAIELTDFVELITCPIQEIRDEACTKYHKYLASGERTVPDFATIEKALNQFPDAQNRRLDFYIQLINQHDNESTLANCQVLLAAISGIKQISTQIKNLFNPLFWIISHCNDSKLVDEAYNLAMQLLENGEYDDLSDILRELQKMPMNKMRGIFFKVLDLGKTQELSDFFDSSEFILSLTEADNCMFFSLLEGLLELESQNCIKDTTADFSDEDILRLSAILLEMPNKKANIHPAIQMYAWAENRKNIGAALMENARKFLDKTAINSVNIWNVLEFFALIEPDRQFQFLKTAIGYLDSMPENLELFTNAVKTYAFLTNPPSEMIADLCSTSNNDIRVNVYCQYLSVIESKENGILQGEELLNCLIDFHQLSIEDCSLETSIMCIRYFALLAKGGNEPIQKICSAEVIRWLKYAEKDPKISRTQLLFTLIYNGWINWQEYYDQVEVDIEDAVNQLILLYSPYKNNALSALAHQLYVYLSNRCPEIKDKVYIPEPSSDELGPREFKRLVKLIENL